MPALLLVLRDTVEGPDEAALVLAHVPVRLHLVEQSASALRQRSYSYCKNGSEHVRVNTSHNAGL